MSEPTGNVIEVGGIYITLGMDEDTDDILGVTVHGDLKILNILGLLTLAREAVLDGDYTQMSDTGDDDE